MDFITINIIIQTFFYSFLPGMGGGLVSFIYGFSKNQYKNGKLLEKLLIELIGSSITATFITLSINNPVWQSMIAFCVGIGWVRLIQLIRNKITKIVEAILGITINGGK